MKFFKKTIESGRESGHLTALAALTLLIFLFLSLTRPSVFLSTNNFRSMAFQLPEIAFLSLAVMLTMLTGGIDLSIVSTALLSAVIGVLTLQVLVPETTGPAPFPALLLALLLILLTGLLCGLGNGLLITRLRISPILATLGTMQLFGGLAVVLTGGTAIYGFPSNLIMLGNESFIGIPVPLLLFIFSSLLVALLLNRTPFGVRVYLTGENSLAARFVGIDESSILTKTYILSGVLSAVAGMIMAARTNSVNADYGASYLLLAILIAILGGVSPSGGFGKVSGLILAVLSLQLLSSGLNMLRFSSFTKDLVWGGLLLVVMSFGPFLRRRRRRAVD